MTVNGKKRSAETTAEDHGVVANSMQMPWPNHQHHQHHQHQHHQHHQQDHHHPCFWGVLHSESLRFVFVSASLHGFLGNEHASAMLNQSLFDYIHPDEANRARKDLVDTFISKSLLGSGIRRFDLEKAGFPQIYRRSSEGHILHQGSPAQHVHEAFERKLSLPIIPDIAKLRNNSGLKNHPPSMSGPFKHPMPKRLRTILEDSIGVRSPSQQPLPNRSGISGNGNGSGSSSPTATTNGGCSGDSENNNSAARSNEPEEDK
ncbi:hypothetical protein LPJ59_002560, partial [Coemansia sp. RSA 2399]